MPRALSHLKMLDLSNTPGAYCSKLFANLGADVILIEPLHGLSLRREGPFYKGEIDPNKSLKFHYLSSDKRSIKLDMERAEGQNIFKRMLEDADIVLESFRPGYLEKIGLSYKQLSEEFPNLIWCSITPFGQIGPYSHFKGDDLVLMSMGGMAYLAGYPEDSPLVSFGEISYYSASLCASVAIMIALQNRHRTGHGDYIDVSIQECVALGTETAPQFYDLQGVVRKRLGDQQREPGMGIYPCKDGYILFYAGEIGGGTGWVNLVQWLNDENIPGAGELKKPEWRDREWKKTEEAKEIFYAIMTKMTQKYTKSELYLEGQRRKIALGPIYHAKDVYENEHLQIREFFTKVSQIGNQAIMGPGAPYLLSETPWTVQRPAPSLGEHTEEILRELGYCDEEIQLFSSLEVI